MAHAFLFTGVRGVGKTTSARILAKALDCVQGPTAKPCQVCPQCREITVGADVDVQEIDGASYNGVDEVRRLQETLPYRPQRDRFKIFIVDEVHMLSNAAWNAFLKTLEEPPPHVKFIFATTEVHKVPVTILSRCQRYDFKLISAQMIAARLRWVLEQEGIKAEEPAVKAVAREAAGSMRDAMSLLDQVLASVGVENDRLTAEGVSKVLGVADRVVLYRVAEAVLTGDAASSVRLVGDLAQQGYDLPHVARDFLGLLRDLVIAKIADDPARLLDLAEDELADVKAVAAPADVDDLTRLHQGFSRAFDDIVRSGQPRASLEMALVRLSRRPPLLPVDELIRRLGDLERRLGGAAPRPPSGGPAVGPALREGRRKDSRSCTTSRAPAGRPSRPPPAFVGAARPRTSTAGCPSRASRRQGCARACGLRPRGPRLRPSPRRRSSLHPARPRRRRRPLRGRPRRRFLRGPPGRAHPHLAPLGPRSPTFLPWRVVLSFVRAKRPALASVLEHAALLRFGVDRVEIGYEASSFLVGQATDAASREILIAALSTHFGRARRSLAFETIAARSGAVTVAMLDTADRKVKLDGAKRAVAEHPLVSCRAIELLGAELRDVRLAEAEA